ncbi:inosine/guanosine kinase [Salmonella sp. NCTC 11881]|nr:inosine/guanosine kinase [Salmonella sp. NCTC 11881]
MRVTRCCNKFSQNRKPTPPGVVGIDQTLVDIEAKVDDDFITRYGLSAGHSLVIEDEVAEKLYQELTREKSDHPSVCWRHHRQYDAQLLGTGG